MEKQCEKSKDVPGDDCNSDHQFLIENFQLRLKKIQPTSPHLRLDLEHISGFFGQVLRTNKKFNAWCLRIHLKISTNSVKMVNASQKH